MYFKIHKTSASISVTILTYLYTLTLMWSILKPGTWSDSKIIDIGKNDPNNYYHRFTQMTYPEILSISQNTWKNINLANLEKFIEPTRNRADIILHKAENHEIDKIYLKNKFHLSKILFSDIIV